MKIKGTLILNYNTKDNAEIVYESLETDNKEFIQSELTDNRITYINNSKSLGTFLATIDDLIASEIITEKIISKTNK